MTRSPRDEEFSASVQARRVELLGRSLLRRRRLIGAGGVAAAAAFGAMVRRFSVAAAACRQ